MSHLPIWYLSQVPIEQCAQASEEYKAIAPKAATMGVEGETTNTGERNTTVRFADKDHWFGKEMFQYGMKSNLECNWGFHLDNFDSDSLQSLLNGEGYPQFNTQCSHLLMHNRMSCQPVYPFSSAMICNSTTSSAVWLASAEVSSISDCPRYEDDNEDDESETLQCTKPTTLKRFGVGCCMQMIHVSNS